VSCCIVLYCNVWCGMPKGRKGLEAKSGGVQGQSRAEGMGFLKTSLGGREKLNIQLRRRQHQQQQQH